MEKLPKKIITWIKNNSGRLLLYAVILTGCFSIKYAAYGKYVDFLKDFTSVTAAPFYFSSNYLGDESEEKKYVIGTFNGRNYELDVEIRNNDNAYNYNDVGTDFYYYVTAELYEDEDYTIPYANDIYSTTIKYGKNNEYAAAMAKEVRDYHMATVSQEIDGRWQVVEVPEYHKNIKIDSSTHEYNSKDEYKLLGRLDGIPGNNGMANVKTEGKQVVRITIAWNGQLDQESIYLKVSAHTVPATTVSNRNDVTSIFPVTAAAQADFGTVLFPENYYNAFTKDSSCPGVIANYADREGIYASELLGKFKLTGDISTQTIRISRNCQSSRDDYAVLYTFASNATTKVRLYYDSKKLTPDDSLGAVYTGSWEKDGGHGGTCDKYVLATLYANGSISCYFYKKTMGTEVDEHDVCVAIDNS